MRIAFALCVLVPCIAQAQVVTLGAHGGVNVAKADGGADSVSPVAGASIDVSLFSAIALRVEAEYGENGTHIGASTSGGPGATDYNVGYLALPINLRFDILTGDVPTYLFAGTTLAAVLYATEEQDGREMDVKSDLRPFDVTLDIGGGIGYRFTPQFAVLCDVRFSYGLLDNAKSDAVLAVDSWRTRNIKVVLGVTYTFNPLAPSAPTMPGMPGM